MNSIELAEDAACHAQSCIYLPAATDGKQFQLLKVPFDGVEGRDILIEALPSLENTSRASLEKIVGECLGGDLRGSNSSIVANVEDRCWLEDLENTYMKGRAFPWPGEMSESGAGAIEFLSQESQKRSPKLMKDTNKTENHAQSGSVLPSPSGQGLNGIREESLRKGDEERTQGKIQKLNPAVPKKRKARGKASRPVPSQLPGMTTRAHPRSRIFRLTDLPDDICPMRRWPFCVRPERPEYPACMEGVEEELLRTEVAAAYEEDTVSTSDKSSEASGEGVAESSGSFHGMEACIVPGALEAVVVFCRTSPLLPSPLRPQPEQLRALLHDTCLLQCVLRGVAPETMAAYLDSVSFRKSAADFRDLNDAAIFVGE